jgi:hypothetical protein
LAQAVDQRIADLLDRHRHAERARCFRQRRVDGPVFETPRELASRIAFGRRPAQLEVDAIAKRQQIELHARGRAEELRSEMSEILERHLCRLHCETLHGAHPQRDLVDDAEKPVAEPHQSQQAFRFLADDELLAVRAENLELHDVRRELPDVTRHRRLEAGRRDGAADRTVRKIESADELEAFIAQDVGELRQRDSRLHRDAIAVDLQHAIHLRQIELGAAAGSDAARHRAC